MANLIIEDGTGLSNANSYISLVEFKNFANLNGIDLSKFNDGELAVFIIRATNYINSFENKMVGKRLNLEQSLAFPRVALNSCDGNPHLYNMRNLKMAVMYAVEVQMAGFSLLPITITKDDIITKEKIGVLEVKYSDDLLNNISVGKFPMVERFLSEYLVSYSFMLAVSR